MEPQTSAPYRSWTLWTLSATGLALVLIAVYVYVADPFLHFHGPWFGYQLVAFEEAYLNPGLARHTAFDAVVIGGSYVQNTKVSTVNKTLRLTSIKLTSAGGTPADIRRLLDLAFRSGGTLKTAIVAIPVTKFLLADSSETRRDLPDYLWDENLLNDVAYLWNIDALLDSAKAIYGAVTDRRPKSETDWLDAAYSWYPRYRKSNGKAYVLKHYSPPSPRADREAAAFLPAAQRQFDTNLRPSIAAHPETTFHFFFPPFSTLLWRDSLVAGQLRAQLEVKKWLSEQLLAYPNVQLHDFMGLYEVTDNLDNYKDRSHFLPPVTERMILALGTGENRLTAPLTNADLQAFVDHVAAYDDPEIPRAKSGRKTELQDDQPVGQDLF